MTGTANAIGIASARNRPSHRPFTFTGECDSARWIGIGVAWATKVGKSFTLTINAMPVSGRVVMRIASDKPTAARQGSERSP